jgi:hypothetical protein
MSFARLTHDCDQRFAVCLRGRSERLQRCSDLSLLCGRELQSVRQPVQKRDEVAARMGHVAGTIGQHGRVIQQAQAITIAGCNAVIATAGDDRNGQQGQNGFAH